VVVHDQQPFDSDLDKPVRDRLGAGRVVGHEPDERAPLEAHHRCDRGDLEQPRLGEDRGRLRDL
jgi:hypothetical protein